MPVWTGVENLALTETGSPDRPVNNNIYYLQLGCHPVAVVNLHVHKYEKKKVTRKFKLGGLRERHVVATWKLGNRLSIRL